MSTYYNIVIVVKQVVNLVNFRRLRPFFQRANDLANELSIVLEGRERERVDNGRLYEIIDDSCCWSRFEFLAKKT